jgi:hypothetical protein
LCADASPNRIVEWSYSVGGDFTDEAFGVANDMNGAVYVTGRIGGSSFLEDRGVSDGFLTKLDASGNLIWERTFGGGGYEIGWDVAIDAAGNPIVVGATSDSLGGTNNGGNDVLVLKYDSDGNEVWTRQFGSTGEDFGGGIAIDPTGNILLSGIAGGNLGLGNSESDDLFVMKLDSAGAPMWVRQSGSSQREYTRWIATDSIGNAYVTGWTRGNLGSSNEGLTDIFLQKYGPAGNLEWSRQLGTDSEELGFGIAANREGEVYIAGYTGGDLFAPNAGASDVYVIKYDPLGNELWHDQFGGNSNEYSSGISVDSNGDVYLTGAMVVGSLPGVPNFSNEDLFLRRYADNGELHWMYQFGTGDFEQAYDIAFQDPREIYVVGRARETDNPISSRMDAVVYKVLEIPEPQSAVLALIVAACGFRWRADKLLL